MDAVTWSSFAGREGEAFRFLPAGADPVEAELRQVVGPLPVGADGGSLQAVFSLKGTETLAQQVCEVDHDELGRFSLFIVPSAPDEVVATFTWISSP